MIGRKKEQDDYMFGLTFSGNPQEKATLDIYLGNWYSQTGLWFKIKSENLYGWTLSDLGVWDFAFYWGYEQKFWRTK
jgi:hypothetical protein